MATVGKTSRWQLYVVLLLFALQLLILFLLSRATENSELFGEWQGWLLGLSSGGLFVFAALIGHSLYHLLTRLRRRVPGTRLTLRLVFIFLMISLVPVAVVYQFALTFLQRGIDSWFAVDIEEGLENALQLSRVALDLPMRDALRQSHKMSETLRPPFDLETALRESGADELALFRPDGTLVLTTTQGHSSNPFVDYPPAAAIAQVLRGQSYVGLEPSTEGFVIRTLNVLPHPNLLLQGLFSVPSQLVPLAQRVQAAHNAYRQRAFLRQPLKTSFSLTLSLVVLTSVLTACYAALYAAQRLVRPIRELAEGTRSVAAGRYDRLVTLPQRRDELSFLVMSFNEMVQSLALAREASARSQRQLERQRAYLETVLTQLSSGVLILDAQGLVSSMNPVAGQLLLVELADLLGLSSGQLIEQFQSLAPFFQAVDDLSHHPEGEREVVLFGASGRRIFMLRSRALPEGLTQRSGTVIVFDEVTALIQAQRDAAWAEVARRLAHEIKNPLTPIQLSAERLRRKLLPQLAVDQRDLLERTTHVIIQQVQALKEMVDDFNHYARPSRLHFTALNGDNLIREVAELFRETCHQHDIDLQLDLQAPAFEADPTKMRQLLNNLVKNAVEAVQDGRGQRVLLRSAGYGAGVEWRIEDDGAGFSPQLGNPFEPYVTTKPKGTGLGLAIVRKIVEEHGGVIELGTASLGGAQILIRLPCRSTSPHLLSSENSA